VGVTVAVHRFAINTVTGTQDITTPDLGGLTPKAAMFITSAGITDGTARVDGGMSVGFTDGTVTGAAGTRADDALGTANTQRGSALTEGTDEDSCVMLVSPTSNALEFRAEFDSWLTDGIRIDVIVAPSVAYLVTVVFFAGSDLTVDVDVVTIGNTVDNETDVTAPGFEPDLVFFTTIGANTPSQTSQGHYSFGVAHFDGASTITQKAVGYQDRDNNPTMRTASWLSSNRALAIYQNTTNAIDFLAEIANFDSSGFSIFERNAGGNNARVVYLALDFGGVVDAWVGSIDTPTATGNDAQTGPGFKPQVVGFGMTIAVSEDANNNSGQGSVGFSVFDADDEYAVSCSSVDSVGTSDNQGLSDNVAVEIPDEDGTALLTATFVSFDSLGWTTNYSAVDTGGAKKFFAFAIEEEAADADIPNEIVQVNQAVNRASTY